MSPSAICELGDVDHQRESAMESSRDARWAWRVLVARVDGSPVGELQLREPAASHWQSGYLGSLVGELVQKAAADTDRVAVLGAIARCRGGAAVSRRRDPWEVAELLDRLVREVLASTADTSDVVCAPNWPEDQLASLLRADRSILLAEPGNVWSALHVAGARDRDDFVASLTSSVRGTWRRDLRALETSGLVLGTCSATAEVIASAAHLVSAVQKANGAREDPMLTEWRISNWVRDTPGQHVAVTAKAGDELVGIGFVRLTPHAVDAYDIGLLADHPLRHVAYTALAFGAPLDLATANGLARVDLGVGHTYPKRNRGAVQSRLWHVVLSGHAGPLS